MTENFPNLGRDADIQINQAHRSCRFNPKRTSSKYIIIKFSKIKDEDKIVKAARVKKHFIQRNPHKNISRFLIRNLASQEKVGGYILSAEIQKLPTKNTLSSKAVLQKWRRDKTFSDKQKLREFNTTRSAL